MKRLSFFCKRFISYLLFVLLIASCQPDSKIQKEEAMALPVAKQSDSSSGEAAQIEPGSNEPVNNDNADVYLLGWSRNGKVLAYRTFFLSEAISRHSYISVEVVDIVSDSVLWSFGKSWDDGNVGEGDESTEQSPTTAGEAWERISAAAYDHINQYDIQATDASSEEPLYKTFPLQRGEDEWDVKLRYVSEASDSYEIVAFSKQKGEKVVYKGQRIEGDPGETEVLGYFINPKADRIAILFGEYHFSLNSFSYYITGCSLNAGFQKQ